MRRLAILALFGFRLATPALADRRAPALDYRR